MYLAVGKEDIFFELVENGAKVEKVLEAEKKQTKKKKFITLLQSACTEGNKKIVSHILSQGANPTDEYERGRSPLHFAAQHQWIEIIKLLVEEYKVDVNLPASSDKGTPLHYALINPKKDVIQCLLDLKADPNKANNKKQTPLQKLKRYELNGKYVEDFEEIEKLLALKPKVYNN